MKVKRRNRLRMKAKAKLHSEELKLSGTKADFVKNYLVFFPANATSDPLDALQRYKLYDKHEIKTKRQPKLGYVNSKFKLVAGFRELPLCSEKRSTQGGSPLQFLSYGSCYYRFNTYAYPDLNLCFHKSKCCFDTVLKSPNEIR